MDHPRMLRILVGNGPSSYLLVNLVNNVSYFLANIGGLVEFKELILILERNGIDRLLAWRLVD